IAAVHPPYGIFLEDQIARMGANHPIIRTQYFCQEIDAQSAMFNAGRMAMIFGTHPLPNPPPFEYECGRGPHAFLIDVAGQDEAASDLEGLSNPGRDSTTLSIVEVDLSTLETLQAPTYRVVMRYSWTGENHLAIFGKLKALAETWYPEQIVIDATGVGEGLWAMLDKAFRTRVIPVKFTRQTKSEIGWKFLSIIETGRFQDRYTSPPPQPVSASLQHASRSSIRVRMGEGVNPDDVRLQYARCESTILPGPQKTLRWGVPDGTRGPDGELVHDDFILADSLVAVLDKLHWTSHSPTLIVQGRDPLEEMDRNY
ncbi:MAG: hypothetical protein ACM3QS_00860, partial [Bacteroidota bacterium]